MSQTVTTVKVENDFVAELRQEGDKLGVGWTRMLIILAKEAMAKRKGSAP